MKIKIMSNGRTFDIESMGVMTPKPVPLAELSAGEEPGDVPAGAQPLGLILPADEHLPGDVQAVLLEHRAVLLGLIFPNFGFVMNGHFTGLNDWFLGHDDVMKDRSPEAVRAVQSRSNSEPTPNRSRSAA